LNENDFSCYRDNVSVVVCVSQAAVPYAARFGIPEEKIVVIHNGVSIPFMPETPFKIEFHPHCPVNGTIYDVSRETLKIPKDAWIWLFVGSQTKEKGPQDIMGAMGRRKRNDEYLILVGYPNPEWDMIALSKDLGIWDRCIHTGVVSSVNSLYDIADCLVVPSHQESLPLVILEAMASGLPILAREVGGVPEIIDGKPYGVMFTGFPDLGMDTARAIFPAFEDLHRRMIMDWHDNWSAERMALDYWALFQRLVG
jgi:glycosyltransferase involved in cell wall biosynthesis